MPWDMRVGSGLSGLPPNSNAPLRIFTDLVIAKTRLPYQGSPDQFVRLQAHVAIGRFFISIVVAGLQVRPLSESSLRCRKK